jgi:hypothetical protein
MHNLRACGSQSAATDPANSFAVAWGAGRAPVTHLARTPLLERPFGGHQNRLGCLPVAARS